MNERIFKSATGKEITLRRPTYKAFRNIANKVAVLTDPSVEFEAAMSTDEFEQVLQAGTVENLDEWLAEADYAEVARLWDAVMSHCEFPAFFAERQQQRSIASKARMELETALQAAQIQALKNSGLLPATYSLENAMSAGNILELNPTSTPSSSTTTPAGTDGAGGTSSASTSGGSSATSPKPSAAGKRSKGS